MLLSLLAVTLFNAPSPPQTLSFKVDGFEREAFVVVGPKAKATGAPVVIAFHGHGGNGNYMMRKMNFAQSWPEAIAVYPTGLPGHLGKVDPDGTRNGWQTRPGEMGDRDLKFVDEILKSLAGEYHANMNKVFSMGHSNGSAFTWLLAAERTKSFAGYCGWCAGGSIAAYRSAPTPSFIIAALNDEIVPLRSVRLFEQGILRRNDCTDDPLIENRIKKYKGKAPVWIYEYDGGHMLPSDASILTVAFFKAQ